MAASTEALTNLPEITVSELAGALKRLVEETFPYVRLRGEVSGYRGPHSSGHVYFSLKDENARIDAVIWKGTFARLRFKPEEGLEVVAVGRVTTYPGKSSYQIVIDSIEPAGVGALMALLEERRKKLAAEGLFAEARKKPLPYLPRAIGVVTSPTGAVIRDILHRLADRFPRRVLVWSVRVQGETCAMEVAAAIKGFNLLAPDGRVPRPDVLIVARGGGSLEDLWGFNEEAVARAAAASEIPIISAVGHETDFTLIDLVADRRAPTPSAAAEMAVPVRAELVAETHDLGGRLVACSLRYLQRLRNEVRALARAIPALDALLALPRQRLDAAGGRLPRALRANAHLHRVQLARAAARLVPLALGARVERGRERTASLAGRAARALVNLVERRKTRLANLDQLLEALSYQGVLARGFALVRDTLGAPVRSMRGVAPGDRLAVEFVDGSLRVIAEGRGTPKPRHKSRGGGERGGQGNLFG
jgi:exodeoxyribonuclease VII large subunit